MQFVAMIMTVIMLHGIKTKYTAIGRKEMVLVFYNYFLMSVFEFLVISNVISASSAAYSWFVAIYMGLVSSCIWVLFYNGFIGFQWFQDGTRKSMWTLRMFNIVVFAVYFVIAFGTFNSWASFLSAKNPIVLFIAYIILNGVLLAIYFMVQLILVFTRLDTRWPLGSLFISAILFAFSVLGSPAISVSVCESSNHYIDGVFFIISFTLLSMMMVYKYYDSITQDDLEFSIPSKSI